MADYQIKAITTKGGIDGSSVLRRCADVAKTWITEQRSPAHKPTRIERIGLLAKFSAGISRAVLGRVIDLEQRIAALEGERVTKSLDAAAYDAMGEIADQLEAMEARLAAAEERTWSYRGYWRAGMRSKRNDAVTHNGSLFLALRDTGETPDSSSVDWAVIARKGRDGKDAR